MKKLLSIIFLFAVVFSACKRDDYATQLEQERKDIQKYIKENYTTVHTYSKFDGVFSNGKTRNNVCDTVTPPEQIYLLGEDSIYFRIIEVGVKTQPVKSGAVVVVRYVETPLCGNNPVQSYWGTPDLPYPLEVIFGDIPYSASVNSNCAGWQSAIGMMKYSETVAEFIVPSKLGLARNFSPVLVPCHYKFSFRVVPR